MAARKKWRTVYQGGEPDGFTSERAVYEFVDALRCSWAAGAPGSVGALTVQVDEDCGMGWETFEFIDFAEEGSRA